MTQVCCPTCRLRFTRAASAYLVACPKCGEPPQLVSSAHLTIGFRLFAHDDLDDAPPRAIAVAMPLPAPAPPRGE
jgi:hypothetical protein